MNKTADRPASQWFAGRSEPGTSSGHDVEYGINANLKGKHAAMAVFSYYKTDQRVRCAAEALAASGMSVDLVCIRENGQEAKREFFNGVNILRVPIAHNRGGVVGYIYQYLAFLLASSAVFASRSLKCRYDLVYVHNMPDFLVLSGLIPKIFGAKVILDLHDPMPELMMTIFGLPPESSSVRLLKAVEKWSMKFADSVVTVNTACATMFASRSCASQKVSVVMNSPDEEIFRFRPASAHSKGPLRKTPFVIMYHGSLVERNGLELAVEAFARVHRSIPGAELRIYGSRNPFLEGVMESVRNLGLDGAVRYLGPKSLEEIAEAIEDCDVGIVPNLRNIFTELNTPTRIFEYLAMGKPVIAPRARGISDYFDDQSLIFFELGNAEDLAQKIKYVFDRPDEAMEVTKRGQKVHRMHSWREEMLRLTGLVANLLRTQGGPVGSAVGRPRGGPAGRSESAR